MKRLLPQLERWTAATLFAGSQPRQELLQEILLLCDRTLSLHELLRLIPERICAALELSRFQVFLREGNAYALKTGAEGEKERFSFLASSSTVLRMRRSRKPAPFVQDPVQTGEPDGWQLLAEPDELAMLRALGTDLLLPLEGRTGLIGFISLGRAVHRAFSPSELAFLRDLGPQMGRGFETAQMVSVLSEQAVERARVHRELELAREVQERLLPRSLPAVLGIAAAAVYRSAEQVGGDYYDLFTIPGGLLCMVIADISGKGVPAALLMATLRATLHALLSEPAAPIAGVVERLNTLLHSASLDNRYATLFLCAYDPRDGGLRSVNAGHNPPILLRSDGRMERLTVGGTVVGLLPEASYETELVVLEPGDTLYAYTDGVTEATNPAGQEWAEEGLERAIVQLARPVGQPSLSFEVDSILSRLDAHVAGAPQADDITLLALRRNG